MKFPFHFSFFFWWNLFFSRNNFINRSSEGSSSQEELTPSTSASTAPIATTATTTTTTQSEPLSEYNSINLLQFHQNDNNNDNNKEIELNHTTESDEMKRAHAKQLIEQYFYMLSNGCGDNHCKNINCASSGNIINKLTPNEAAARAIQLYKDDAPICGLPKNKIARKTDQNSKQNVSTNLNDDFDSAHVNNHIDSR